MTVGSAELDWGQPPWRVEGFEAGRRPSAQLPERVDVAVVGAGFTGLAAAYALARRGVRVAVLEAARVGAGASGRTGGLVLEDTAAGPLDGVEACIPALERLLRETGINCQLDLGGCHELVHDAPDCETQHPLRWSDGEAVLRVDVRVPGGVLDPGALCSGLARAASAAGATLHEGVRVRRIEGGPRLVLAFCGGTLICDHAVLAINAYTPDLVPELAGLRSALTLALCTEAVSEETLRSIGLADRRPFYTIDLPYLWGRVLSDRRLVFGAGLAFAPGGQPQRVAISAGEAAERLATLERRVRTLHPALAGVRIESRWGGPVAFRSGGVPILGRHPSLPHVILVGAFAGHGVALGPRVGELAAAAVVDGEPIPGWGGLDR